MTSKHDSDWDKTVQEVEVELNPDKIPEPSQESPEKLTILLGKLQSWFNTLPLPAKTVVVIVGIIGTFSLLNTVLKVVTSLLTIAILGIVGYWLYKNLLAPKS